MSQELYFGIASALSTRIAWKVGRYLAKVTAIETNEGSRADSILEFQRLAFTLLLVTIATKEYLLKDNSEYLYLSIPLLSSFISYANISLRSIISKWKLND